ncbi:hypothetical protein F2Q69_00025479 [Brassica cretica]|uniref:Uncharacterized protein n=1 Tax=Brassica cretica TaxID=69181 RepID=A0A8S9QHD8_BRACR|nr:hypothetical protein F2Q69_00025479 [Brassica cretica]
MVKALQTRLPPISRKKKRRGHIVAYISRGGILHVVEGSIRCEIQQEDSNSRRIQVNDKHVIFFVDCDGSGVKFVHAAAKTVSVTEEVSESLLAVQVTELKDGVFIGYGVNHLVADGTSFWSFF